MTASDATDPAAAPAQDDGRARKNAVVLATAMAVLSTQMGMFIVLLPLAGQMLAETKALATLPVGVAALFSMLSAAPLSHFMTRHGRRAGFWIGTLGGAAGATLSAMSIFTGDFRVLLAGAACLGVYMSSQGFMRFAAADLASPGFRPKAIGWVIAGGLFGTIAAPEVMRLSEGAVTPLPFASVFLAAAAINVLGALVLVFVDIPKPPKRSGVGATGRRLREILAQPRAAVALISALVSYALMSLVMTSTPLAMQVCGFSPDQSADVVRWHAVAMFAPSFFTGALIVRFGHLRVISAGLVCLAGCAVVALSGVEIERFYIALILVGLGWNFGFIGGTAMLTDCHTSEERAKVQAANDVIVFGAAALASFGSGALLNLFGWNAVNLAIAPFVALAGGALLWIWLAPPQAATPGRT